MFLFSGEDAGRLVREIRDLLGDARKWVMQDERRKTIGMVIASVAVSIALSLLTTAIVGAISRRGAAAKAVEAEPEGTPPEPAEDAPAGVAVMDVPASDGEAEVPAGA